MKIIPEKTGIYRITHLKNLPFILKNGLHCPNSETQDTAFVSIGFPTLVANRNTRTVEINPYGTLADYVPFYFAVKSPMLYVIYKGNDPEVINTPQEEIIYLVSTLGKLNEHGLQYIFTDRHAQLDYANFYSLNEDLDKLNWEIIRTPYWGRQYGPERMEVKQAECLIYKHLPVQAIIGIGCYNERVVEQVRTIVSEHHLNIETKVKNNWYF